MPHCQAFSFILQRKSLPFPYRRDIDTLNDAQQLFPRQKKPGFRLCSLPARYPEPPRLKPFSQYPEPVPVPYQDFHQNAAAVYENKVVPAGWILPKVLPNRSAQPVETLPHIHWPRAKIYRRPGTKAKHHFEAVFRSRTAISPRETFAGILKTRPSPKDNSKQAVEIDEDKGGAIRMKGLDVALGGCTGEVIRSCRRRFHP